MISDEIKTIRELFSKETTLPHNNENGHTQFYSEWLERKLVKAESDLKAPNSDYVTKVFDKLSEISDKEDRNCPIPEKEDWVPVTKDRLNRAMHDFT